MRRLIEILSTVISYPYTNVKKIKKWYPEKLRMNKGVINQINEQK